MDPDPTPFFSEFKDAKKIIYFIFLLITYQQAHHCQSRKLNFLLKFCVEILFCKHYFSQFNTFMRKGKDPDPYLPLNNGSGSGRPKYIRIRFRIRIPSTGVLYIFRMIYVIKSICLWLIFRYSRYQEWRRT
jgi:hypothetical protein